MASEITYAEVKFKNASPAAVAEAPPEEKKHEQHPQKYPLCLPWLISLLLFLVCIALIVALLDIAREWDDESHGQLWDAGSRHACSFCWEGSSCEKALVKWKGAAQVAPFSRSRAHPTALQQKFKEWQCVSGVLPGKEESWTCCPKGWRHFQEKCYYLSDDTMSWAESEQNCTGMGSHLVVINSKAEQDFLFEELHKPSTKGVNYYIGLSAQEVGQWHWLDGTPLSETAAFWRAGEPSNVGDEKCVVIHTKEISHSNWNDVNCKGHHRICQAAAVTM